MPRRGVGPFSLRVTPSGRRQCRDAAGYVVKLAKCLGPGQRKKKSGGRRRAVPLSTTMYGNNRFIFYSSGARQCRGPPPQNRLLKFSDCGETSAGRRTRARAPPRPRAPPRARAPPRTRADTGGTHQFRVFVWARDFDYPGVFGVSATRAHLQTQVGRWVAGGLTVAVVDLTAKKSFRLVGPDVDEFRPILARWELRNRQRHATLADLRARGQTAAAAQYVRQYDEEDRKELARIMLHFAA